MTISTDFKPYAQNASYYKRVLYNFYGTRLSSKIPVQDGLALGAMLVENWLHKFLGDDATKCLAHNVEKGKAKRYRQQMPPSRHICNRYLIDTVSDMDRGIWTMRFVSFVPNAHVNKNDEGGSDSVGFSTVEENIGLSISDGNVHVGISFSMHIPNGCSFAGITLPTPLNALALHPLFGLKSGTPVKNKLTVVDTQDKFRTMIAAARDSENRLPMVLFTYLHGHVYELFMKQYARTTRGIVHDGKDLFNQCMKDSQQQFFFPAYDVNKLASEQLFGLANVYLIDDSLMDSLCQELCVSLKPGDTVMLPSGASLKNPQVFPFRPSEYGKMKTLSEMTVACIKSLTKIKIPDSIIFFADAEQLIEKQVQEDRKEAIKGMFTAEQMEAQAAQYQKQLDAFSEKVDQLQKQNANLKEYTSRLENEKNEMRQELDRQKELLQNKERADQEEIDYLRRALDRPTEHTEIAAWAEKHFGDHLTIIPKAAAMLEENSAREISLPLICDALDFLATDYWENRFNRMTWEQVLSNCSAKYKRPFDVSRIGELSISYMPSDYIVMYQRDKNETPVERKLDQHLKVGNGKTDSLLRIYFFLDEEKKKIVVGSLPKHLKVLCYN